MDDDAVRQSDSAPSVSVDYAFRATFLAADASSGSRSYAETLRSPDRQSWEQAVEAEMQSMLRDWLPRVSPKYTGWTILTHSPF